MNRNERGAAASVWMSLLVMVMAMTIGISVDLTGLVNAKQRTFDLAQQAARTAANQVEAAQAMRGQVPVVDVAAARTAAAGYLNAAGVRGTVSVTGPRSLHVHVTASYQPKFLGSIGVGPRQVAGDADVTLTRVVGGVQR